MDRNKKLLKNTIIITISKICTQLITFLLLPFYTGILSTAEYGTIDLLNTIVTLLIPIITFQLEQAAFRELIESRADIEKESTIITTSLIIILFQFTLYSIIFFIIFPFINNNYKVFLYINIATAIFSSFFLQIARGLGDNKKYAIGSFISASFTIIFNVFLLAIVKMRVEGMLIANIIGQIANCTFLFFSLHLSKYISYKYIDKKKALSLLKYSIPLVPNQISWWVFNVSDRVIVSCILGVAKNGLLSAASKFSSVYVMVFSIFNMSITETIAVHIKDKDIEDYFNKIFNTITTLFLSICIFAISCMPIVFPLLINSKFAESYGLIPILLISSFFNIIVSLIGIIYIAHKNTKAVANTSIISAIINIISHLLMIKYFGLYAAAISTFLAFFTMTIYRMFDMKKKYFAIKLDKKNIFFSTILLAMVTIIFYINKMFFNIISPILSLIIIFFLNRKIILSLFNIIKNKFNKGVNV